MSTAERLDKWIGRVDRALNQDLISVMADAADEITRLRSALHEIAYARPVGETPKTVSGVLIERIESIALKALAS